jgi:hypothetical protein
MRGRPVDGNKHVSQSFGSGLDRFWWISAGHKFLGALHSQAGTDGYWFRGAASNTPQPETVGRNNPLARDNVNIHLLAREKTFQIRKKELEVENASLSND